MGELGTLDFHVKELHGGLRPSISRLEIHIDPEQDLWVQCAQPQIFNDFRRKLRICVLVSKRVHAFGTFLPIFYLGQENWQPDQYAIRNVLIKTLWIGTQLQSQDMLCLRV